MDHVQMLIEAGADINAVDKLLGRTALMDAVKEGHIEVVQTLIERGADVNIEDRWDTTALDEAKDEKIERLIRNAKKIRAEYLKNHPQTSLRKTLTAASKQSKKVSTKKKAPVKKQKTR